VSVRIHPTAIVEPGVELGEGTSVWDNVHIRGPARIGRSCIVGGKSYVAYGVEIGDFTKINSFVYIPTGVTIGRGVMISAGTIFTNDPTPRATDPDLLGLQDSGWQASHETTVVEDGASIGAGCRIGPGVRIGAFAMVGMGAIVTKDVAPFHLVIGTPARAVGAVCRCGGVVHRGDLGPAREAECPSCRRAYRIAGGAVLELERVAG
jgi:UDP-2-acetamido-3-amino-2,3-dideoxy-glucuronate N-acetyltransferase